MSEIINGWFAYVIATNSVATFLFAGMIVAIIILLTWMQMLDDKFDLRAIISTYKDGHYVPTTDKTLLVGCWIVSSYAVFEHYSDSLMGVYLGAWVLNGGVAAWSKARADKEAKGALK
jgi:hypothetical protein